MELELSKAFEAQSLGETKGNCSNPFWSFTARFMAYNT